VTSGIRDAKDTVVDKIGIPKIDLPELTFPGTKPFFGQDGLVDFDIDVDLDNDFNLPGANPDFDLTFGGDTVKTLIIVGAVVVLAGLGLVAGIWYAISKEA
jgi:hypothetical protein